VDYVLFRLVDADSAGETLPTISSSVAKERLQLKKKVTARACPVLTAKFSKSAPSVC